MVISLVMLNNHLKNIRNLILFEDNIVRVYYVVNENIWNKNLFNQ